MIGSALFIFLICSQSVRGGPQLLLPSPPQHTSIWTLWDLVSSSASVIGTLRSAADSENYQYEYKVGEEGGKNFMSRDENMEDNVVTGTYSYVDPYGTLITVDYIADEQGYREVRKTEPGFVQIVF